MKKYICLSSLILISFCGNMGGDKPMSLNEFNQIKDDSKKVELFNSMNKKNKMSLLKELFSNHLLAMGGPRSELYFSPKGKIVEVRDDNWKCEIIGEWSFEDDKVIKIDEKSLGTIIEADDADLDLDEIGLIIRLKIKKLITSSRVLKESKEYLIQYYETADPRIKAKTDSNPEIYQVLMKFMDENKIEY